MKRRLEQEVTTQQETNYWDHRRPEISKKRYRWKDVKPKNRFDFGEDDE